MRAALGRFKGSFCILVLSLGTAFLGLAEATVVLNLTDTEVPYDIDPASAGYIDNSVSNQFLALVDYDYANMKVVPAAASSWKVSPDGRICTFTLREDVKWSDNTPTTARDFEYSFKKILDPATWNEAAYLLYVIKNAEAIHKGEIKSLDALGVKAIDDYTLQIELVSPAVWFLSSLATIGHAAPRAAREKYGNDWTRPENIIVNGPFKLKEIKPGERWSLVKNPLYYDAKNVQIDQINFLVTEDLSAGMTLYESGQVDSVEVPPEDIDRVKSDPKLSKEYYNGPRSSVYFYIYNVNKAPFNNPLIRKAFAAAIDRDFIVKQVTRGGEVPAYTMTPPGCAGSVPTSAGIGIRYDPEQARKWLAEADYPKGKGLPAIVYTFNTSKWNKAISEALQKMWKDALGVDVQLQSVDWGAYLTARAQGTYSFWRMGWFMDYPDAHNILGDIFHSTPAYGAWNFPELFRSQQLDTLLDAAAVEQNPDRRNALYQEAEKILVQEEVVVVPLFYSAESFVTKPFVTREYSMGFPEQYKAWRVDK